MSDMEQPVQEQPIVESAPAQVPPARVGLTQDEINRLVGEARVKGREAGLQEARSSMAPALSREDLEKQMREIAAQVQFEQTQKFHVQQLLGKLSDKVETGKQMYPDFEQKLTELQLHTMPALAAELAEVDPDVIYDIADNPYKAMSINAALKNGTPHLARKELNKLAASIKENKKAAAQTSTSSGPLSSVKPSAISGDNGGKMTIADFKKADWLRR